MEPVKGGTLATLPEPVENLYRQHHPDWSVASWAIRYAASLDGVTMVLSGMSNLAQMLDNTAYMENFTLFTREDHEVVQSALSLINSTIAIPCTACQYCVDGCPGNIAIPEYFSLYNTEKLADSKGFSLQKYYYENYARTRGKASDCIECNACEESCPQHLPIIRHLKAVTEVFESKV
jgi:predicted aldo/keto reductase-like oxidoreductase